MKYKHLIGQAKAPCDSNVNDCLISRVSPSILESVNTSSTLLCDHSSIPTFVTVLCSDPTPRTGFDLLMSQATFILKDLNLMDSPKVFS